MPEASRRDPAQVADISPESNMLLEAIKESQTAISANMDNLRIEIQTEISLFGADKIRGGLAETEHHISEAEDTLHQPVIADLWCQVKLLSQRTEDAENRMR